jgi:hypothetical protein
VTRFILTVAASTAVLVLLLGAVGFVAARNILGAHAADAAALGPWAAQAPLDIQGLRDIPPAERFGHFLGAQMRFTDANGAAHTVTTTPGTVDNVTSDKLTIKANDGGASKTYNLTSQTRIHAGGQPWAGGQTNATTPKSGDKVVVLSQDNSSDAQAVMIGGADGFRPGPGGFHGGFRSQGGPPPGGSQ